MRLKQLWNYITHYINDLLQWLFEYERPDLHDALVKGFVLFIILCAIFLVFFFSIYWLLDILTH